MAKFIVINQEYQDDGGVYERLFLYMTRAEKTMHGFIGAQYVYMEQGVQDIAKQMREVAETLNGNQGRALWHFVLSFDRYDEWWITPAIAYQIAGRFVLPLLDGHQVVYAVHEDTENVHVHFMVNATNFYTGMKFENKRENFQHIADMCSATVRISSQGEQKRIGCQVCYQENEDFVEG